MKFIKQFSMSFLAVAAFAASAATSQPFTAATAIIKLDTSYLNANSYTVGALGASTYNAATGTLTDPLQGVSILSNPGALSIDFSDTSGLSLKKGLTTVKLTDFTFDIASNSLFGTVTSGIFVNLPNISMLTATSVRGDFGGSDALNSITTSSTPRALNFLATGFVLSESFKTLLTENGVDPTSMAFVASIVKSVAIGTGAVPEPTTYALMGLGLVGIAFAARRKQA
ncbi:MAG: PEP-CTERM sorting domain-containing protein [Aquabacterium sp.]|nr:PEP-CTERM sorting domain-containing protein [Aquabacterium sp.]